MFKCLTEVVQSFFEPRKTSVYGCLVKVLSVRINISKYNCDYKSCNYLVIIMIKYGPSMNLFLTK